MEYLLVIVLLIYVGYTLTFTIKFIWAESQYTTTQKRLHIFLLWVLPFIWIFIVKRRLKADAELNQTKRRRSDWMFNENETGVDLDGGHVHDASDEIGWNSGDD